MLDRLRRLFGAGPASAAQGVSRPAADFAPIAMTWYDGTRLPLPVWEEIAKAAHPDWNAAERDGFRTAAAGHWLQALAARLGPEYRVHESEDFLLLSALDDRPVEVFLQFCQSVRRRIVRNLDGIAAERSDGKHAVLVFADQDAYYDYIAHYYPDDGGEYAMSAGMFVHAGYGHFALPEIDMEQMQPTIAHELTHCLLSHLPIPAWLNEGLAVNTEHALFPQYGDPRFSLYRPQEIAAKHAAFWNSDTLQEFWSGKSFLRTDDGNMLSYDLAKRVVGRAARAEDAFRAFVLDADSSDAGQAACERWLDCPLEALVVPMLGAGDWRPDPARWRDGVERGQFGVPPSP
jgi:hypothetical protein